MASAIDSKINVIISIGIILGALLSDFGKSQRIPLLYYCDPIIAIIVSFFIFRELIEIFVAFIKGKEDKIQFEKFQMPYEANFKEYVIKWILMTYIDDPKSTFTSKDLEEMF